LPPKLQTSASLQLWTLEDAYRGPGHLIRRLQQIAVAIFMDEFEKLEITPVQYMALIAVRYRPGLEQQAIADLIAIDRSSAGRVFQFLEQRRLVQRVTPENNRRIKQAFITPAGRRMVIAGAKPIRRAEERILKVLKAHEQQQFLQHLIKLADVNNALSRAPLRIPANRGPKQNGRAADVPMMKDKLRLLDQRDRMKGRESW
jgi:MarR family transcriptional regulator, lower aerobic nicotinate degradation pathway regulator